MNYFMRLRNNVGEIYSDRFFKVTSETREMSTACKGMTTIHYKYTVHILSLCCLYYFHNETIVP